MAGVRASPNDSSTNGTINKLYSIGVVWDDYTPAVEGQLLRDLIALQDSSYQWKDRIQVVCSSSDADRLLASLGIQRISVEDAASLYLVYQTKANPITNRVPANAKTVVRCLYVPKVNTSIHTPNNTGFDLPPQDRPYYNSQFDRPPPVHNNNVSSRDPLVTLVWSR